MSTRTDSVSETKGASGFNASSNILDFRPILANEVQLVVDFAKVPARQDFETRDHSLACEISGGLVRGRLWDLDLQGAFSKVETEDLVDVVLHFGFEDHVVTGDTEIDIALSDERRDIRSREKHPVRLDQSRRGLCDDGRDSQRDVVV